MNNKGTIQQVLGCLIQKPQLLSEVDKYNLELTDFNTRLERYIFMAIDGLYRKNATSINPIDIENYLQVDDVAATTFKNSNGIEYVQDIIELSKVENFDYYYNKLKKLNLLRDLEKQGFDISSFYQEDLTKSNAEEINANFENLTTQDICDNIKKKVLRLESSYAKSAEIESTSMAENIEEFISELNETVDIGLPIQGQIFNKVLGGAELGALTIRSASSGVGKTRLAVADACYLAYPIRYDSKKKEWEQIGNCEKVLFIITEQSFKQIKKMVLAYLTDINEDRFKLGNFNEEETKIINKAIQIIQKYADNFIIEKIPAPTIELVKTVVRERCLTKDIRYVFFDYIFINPALLKEFKGFSLRDDEILLMFATALKDLAVELNVSVFTSTQVNAKADDNKNIRNEASLAGGRATINKADNGAIMARPTPEELETLDPLIKKYGKKPTIVTDIFKVRSGKWTQVRIWSIADLGKMKKEDLFITDARLEPIENFYEDEYDYNMKSWDETELTEIEKFVKELNK